MEPLLYEIGETAHTLRRAFDRRAAALGVTRAQWKVLSRLNRQPGLRQVELADLCDVEAITLCRIVDRLEEAELVERQRDPSDRRAWRLELTPKAAPIVKQLMALADELAEEAFAGLEAGDIALLRERLGRIRTNLTTAPGGKKASNQ